MLDLANEAGVVYPILRRVTLRARRVIRNLLITVRSIRKITSRPVRQNSLDDDVHRPAASVMRQST